MTDTEALEWVQRFRAVVERLVANVDTLCDENAALRADNRRHRELERAVRAIVYHVDSDAGRDRHWFIRERVSQEQSDAIGRLLEGEG